MNNHNVVVNCVQWVFKIVLCFVFTCYISAVENPYDVILKNFDKQTNPGFFSPWTQADYCKDRSKDLLNKYNDFLEHVSDEKPFINLKATLNDVLSLARKVLITSWKNIPGAIYFYDKDKPYYEFTNFYTSKVVLNIGFDMGYNINASCKTVEHYYQAMKFNDIDIRKKILNLGTPRDALKYAQKDSMFVRKDWKNVNLLIMFYAVTEKFRQNETLKQMLLDTGNRILVEDAGENDSFYGAGADYQGENHLGRMLMTIRINLRDNTDYEYNPMSRFLLGEQELDVLYKHYLLNKR